MDRSLTRTDRIAVTVINILLILFFVFFVLAVVFLMRPNILHTGEVPLIYTVRFPLVRTAYTYGIEKGDSVLDAVGKREIGQVIDVTISPAMTETYDRTHGRLRSVAYPDHVTLTLRIRCNAYPTDDGWSLSGLVLSRGKKLPLRLPNFAGTGICVRTETEPTV